MHVNSTALRYKSICPFRSHSLCSPTPLLARSAPPARPGFPLDPFGQFHTCRPQAAACRTISQLAAARQSTLRFAPFHSRRLRSVPFHIRLAPAPSLARTPTHLQRLRKPEAHSVAAASAFTTLVCSPGPETACCTVPHRPPASHPSIQPLQPPAFNARMPKLRTPTVRHYRLFLVPRHHPCQLGTHARYPSSLILTCACSCLSTAHRPRPALAPHNKACQ